MASNGCDGLNVTNVLIITNLNNFGFKKLKPIPFGSVESW